MERRDYLESQIQQLAQVLASMIGFLTGKKGQGTEESDESVSLALREELDFSLDELLSLSDDEFVEALQKTGKFNAVNFERLADVFFALAENTPVANDNVKLTSLYSKSLLVYKFIEKSDKNYSLTRNEKIRKIEARVERL